MRLPRPTPLDRGLFARCAGLALATAGAALLVMTVSDEPTSGLAERLTRLAALCPVVAFAAATMLRERMERRGERLGLAAAGVPPARGLLGLAAVVAGSGVVGGAAIALGGRAEALVPRLPEPAFVARGGAFVAARAGVVLDDAGVSWVTASAAPPSPHALAPLAAGIVVFALGLAALAVREASWTTRLALFAVTLVVAVVALHAGPEVVPFAAVASLALVLSPWRSLMGRAFPRYAGRSPVRGRAD